MKILFLIFHGFSLENGISKKISYQLEAFKSLGHEVHIAYMDESLGKKRMIDRKAVATYPNNIIGKLEKRIEFSSIIRYTENEHIDFVYIRSNHNANPFTIRMVKKIKAIGTKVVMEIPTYPYDAEYGKKRLLKHQWPDLIFRNSLAKQLDAIVTFSDDDFIFGQRTIKISNGIDFNNVHLKTTINDTSRELNLIGVAEIHGWHGFDRIVKGLADYYAKPQSYIVRFHIVGYFYSQEEEEEIKTIIRQCKMEDYVIFYGRKHGNELDNIFNKCDFGVGSLGRHRVGIQQIKTLKNREYAARGIAFTYSETDKDFDDKPYVLKMPADESPIDIERIVRFYKNMTISPEEIRNSIKKLSWENQMDLVLQGIFPKKRVKTHIAYCIPSLDRASGMERVLTNKANYLTNILDYDVTVILTDNKGTKPFFPLSDKINIIQLDVNIDNLWMYPLWKRLLLYLWKIREYRHKLEKVLKAIRPDITISLLRREINFLTDIKDGSKKMGEIHFGRYKYRESHLKYIPNFANQLITKLWNKQLDRKIKKLDKFVILTNEDAVNWKSCNNICVISNPITIESINKSTCKTKRVIAVGRYTYQKGFDLLIKAWSMVAPKHPDWSLHLYGAGNSSYYYNLIKNWGVKDSVFCHQATKNIISEYLNSSIFAFSSRFEGFGLVIAEAMSVGLPCVAFACPCGPSDIIRNGEDGILCPNGDVNAMAEGICKLIEDEKLRHNMSSKARVNIQRYSIDNIMQQWDKIFKNVINQNN